MEALTRRRLAWSAASQLADLAAFNSSCISINNASEESIAELNFRVQSTKLYIRIFGWNLYLLPLSFIGILLTLLYIFGIYRTLKRKKMKRKIFYILLLSMAVRDFLLLIIQLIGYLLDWVSWTKWNKR